MAQDPLRLLVKAVSGGNGSIELLAPDRTTTVHELKECGFLSFPSISSAPVILAKDTPTRYKRDESSFYDLASLLFCYLKKEDGAGEYFKAAQEQQVVPAGVMERRAVTELLEGKRPEGDSVVPIGQPSPLETKHFAHFLSQMLLLRAARRLPQPPPMASLSGAQLQTNHLPMKKRQLQQSVQLRRHAMLPAEKTRNLLNDCSAIKSPNNWLTANPSSEEPSQSPLNISNHLSQIASTAPEWSSPKAAHPTEVRQPEAQVRCLSTIAPNHGSCTCLCFHRSQKE